MEKINWGILGLGEIAHKFSTSFLETTNAKLLAVASRNINKLKRFKEQFNIEPKYLFNSYEDLINCKEIDIVYIALPNSLHHDWVIKSIKNKKHTLVEKPVTLNFQEMQNIEKKLIDQKLFFGEAFMYRYHPQVNLVLNIIKNGEIGNLVSMKSQFGANLMSKKKFWFLTKKKKIDPNNRIFNKELGGGCILDLGCYPSSFSLLIASLISKQDKQNFKISNITKEIGETNVDIDSHAKITFSESFFSEISASFKTDLGNKTKIIGNKGTIIINDTWLGSNEIIQKSKNGNKIIDTKNDKNIYSYQIQNISENILNNSYQIKYPGMSLKESLINMRIIEEWLNA